MEEAVSSMPCCLVALTAVAGADIVLDIGIHVGPEEVSSDDLDGLAHANVSCNLGVVLFFTNFASEICAVIAAFWNLESPLII